MIPQEHVIVLQGGTVRLHLDESPEPEMLSKLIEPLMRAAKEIEDALVPERREGQDEKSDEPEGAAPVGECR